MAIWEKLFSKITFKDYPDTSTPLNADNLNKMTDAIDGIDDRVVELNSNLENKADYTPKARLWEDNEGGNLQIIGNLDGAWGWQIDNVGGSNLRIFTQVDGAYKMFYFKANGDFQSAGDMINSSGDKLSELSQCRKYTRILTSAVVVSPSTSKTVSIDMTGYSMFEVWYYSYGGGRMSSLIPQNTGVTLPMLPMGETISVCHVTYDSATKILTLKNDSTTSNFTITHIYGITT